ncbi:MAG: AzlD domain-containing protein [Candidatus Riflebacteria bacterium]|nr:AzlD domain-containing protein [Candidatus Riflebacteria bacterium]
MESGNIYIYIAVMAIVTYIIRALPLTLIRREIKSPYIRSFLYYVPYATLSAMTFPAILHSARSPWAGGVALFTALMLAYYGKSLLTVATGACLAVYIIELAII